MGPEQVIADETSSLIAASDCASTPIISINGHRPAASAEPPVIRVIIVPLASIMALTVTRSTDVNSNAIRADVDTLSQGWCRSHSGHCTNESERDQRCLNPHEL